ncbi:MAG: hypothetical protein ACRED1_11080, partial [Limisphaerales bacterium]
LMVAVLSAASLLPYAPILTALASSGPTSLIFRTGATLRRFIWSCEDTLAYPLWGYLYVWAALAAIIIVRAGMGLRRRSAGQPLDDHSGLEYDFSLFASVTVLLAAVGFPIFFWKAQMPMQSWYLLPFLALAVVCFDGARPAFPGLLRIVFVALAAGGALLSGLSTANLLTGHFSNVNRFAKELTEKAGPKDYILVYPWNWAITFNYYYKGAAPWDSVPPLADHSIHRVDLILAQMENTNALAPVLRRISKTLASGHRVWFLGPATTRLPAAGAPAPAPLPLPPLKYSGWSESPYSSVWCSQTLQFIADDSRTFRPFKFSAQNRYLTENANVFVADGCRTNTVPMINLGRASP